MEEQIKDGGKNYAVSASIVIAVMVLALTWIYATGLGNKDFVGQTALLSKIDSERNLENSVLPKEGVVLPVVWGDLGKQMIDQGVIDREKFESLYKNRGGMTAEESQLLYGNSDEKLMMNAENSGFLLNLFWGLGLGNKNDILENGPMSDPRYGGAGRFASTGGWVVASGDVMEHYSKHSLVTLTAEQQKIVERISKGIYRPCCGNSTYFPDCNHGMAMLGLLELMAAQGVSEEDMYKVAFRVNSYWFPDTYLTIAKYFENKGIKWNEVDPKVALGADFSSASGYQRVLRETEPIQLNSGGGCGL